MQALCGWLNRPEEVERLMKGMKIPLFGNALPCDEKKTVLLSDNFKKVTGVDQWPGPQLIGDCVSMGWGGGTEDLQIGQILSLLSSSGFFKDNPEHLELASAIPLLQIEEVKDVLHMNGINYKDIATESIYGFSRCEVGGQWNSHEDGSVGAWAADAVTKFGVLTRESVGPYDGKRAKLWGAKGVPDNLEAEARLHLWKITSQVSSFTEAAAAIQGFKPVMVCSNRGFSMNRDKQGFCSPSGSWGHCMRFMGVRWDRPGLLCFQRWGANNPSGPTDLNQPSNTFWVDADVADRMLKQGDSFTGDHFEAYKSDNFVDWSF